MGYKQQLMTLIMGGISSEVEVQFPHLKKGYKVEAFIYQGDYFEVIFEQFPLKEKQKIPLEGILNIEVLSEKEYRIDYETESVFLRGKK